MKKLYTILASFLYVATLFAQPVLNGDSLHSGLSFNLYSLSNVNTANLLPAGANVTWDLSTATATLSGTAELLDMSATPFAAQYPNANFAIKLSPTGQLAQYSLFNLSNAVFEEVANNVGTPSAVSFTDYRTALPLPFTFNLVNADTYQKVGQNQKTIVNNYDAYGTFITNTGTFTNVVRNAITDDGNTSFLWWNSSPFMPLFQASSSGFILWQSTTPSAVADITNNSLFDMYPNPATNQLVIINKELISKIEIINDAGQLQFTTSKTNIDISSLKTGVYYLKAYSLKGIVSQKFIKE